MKKIHYAWLICIGCTLLLFCTVGLSTSSFSVYQPYLIASGLSNTQSSTVITVRSLFAVAAMFFVGKYHEKAGLRLGVALAAAGTGLSFFIYSNSHGFWGYCLASAVAGIAYGLGGMIPVSVIIGHWFEGHRSFALGLCSAGSGVATIIVPPIVTALIEATSLRTTFFFESVFIAVSAAVVFAVVRNDPKDKKTTPFGSEEVPQKAKQRRGGTELSHKNKIVMILAMMMLGAVANTGFAHVTVLYKTSGFNSMMIAFMLSFEGAVLTAGKCIYGLVTDKMGAYRSGYIFFSILVTGVALCCLAGSHSLVVAYAAMIFLGIGLPLATVGQSAIAGDMSTADQYASAVRMFQMAYMVGALLFGPVPGMIADRTGSYVPAFVVLTFFSALCMAMVQYTYLDIRKSGAGKSGSIGAEFKAAGQS